MEETIIRRGGPEAPCLYLMGGEEIRGDTPGDAWVIQVQGADWNRDFSPWKAPRVFAKGDDFSGGADAYLAQLLESIPVWEKRWDVNPCWRGIAGYSLVGLFSLFALIKTPLFSRCGCFSGSLWFPGWIEYLEHASFEKKPDYVFLSLGDREGKTRNPLLSSIDECTRKTGEMLSQKGVRWDFVSHPGGHFDRVDERIETGIGRIVSFLNKG